MSSDVDAKCRTCMCECSTFHQLYDYVDENYKILEMLDDIVPQIHIKTESSTFSHLVCQLCVEKLLTGYKFQRLCIETNNRLHEMLKADTVGEEKTVQVEPELEKVFDPLTGVESIKMKQEAGEIDGEMDTANITRPVKSEEAFESDNGLDVADAEIDGSATDSSNEKLSVLKQRNSKKSVKFLKVKKRSKKVRLKTEFSCNECGKVFDRLYRLKRHGAVHVKKGAYSCEICKYSFAAEKTYAAHMQLHDEDAKEGANIIAFTCEYCPKSFEKKAALMQHTQTTHSKCKDKSPKKRGRKKGIKNRGDSDEMDHGAVHVSNMSEIWEDTPLALLHLPELSFDKKEDVNDLLDKEPNIVIKNEIELAQRLYKDAAEDFVENADWLNNELDTDYTEHEDDEHKDALKTDISKNIDFVDTGIGEIEKPNTRNRRNGNYPCQICGKVFDRPYRLKRHSSVHSLERPHACEFCKYRFATANLLKIHMMQHESESGGNLASQSRPDGFKCPDCPRRFEKQASLSAHRQIHTRNVSQANYPCTVCDRSFMSVRSLTDHITNKHPEVERHKCDQCVKTFVLHAHLVEHLNRHKGNKNLVCLICEKEFGYTNTLKEHMRTHSGESPFLCPQCGKTFRSSSNLRQHMERHFGLKKYQCPECPSRFNCRSDLIKHMSTHSNAKPHVCDVCGSRFTRAYSLQKHKILHSGDRPFKCDQCNMTFAIIYHLRRHMRTHTGEKPYKCKYCDRAYAESGDLTKHLRTHVGENTYMCDQCPMAFKYHQELRQHVSEHYKMAQQLLTHAQQMSDEAQQLDENKHENILMPVEQSIPPLTPPPAPTMDLGC